MTDKQRSREHIYLDERDRSLSLKDTFWPVECEPPEGWTAAGGQAWLSRDVPTKQWGLKIDLRESMLRFPSAPVHALQRRHPHEKALGSESFHSYRVFQAAHRTTEARPVTRRIFLMHNGLNECAKFGLHQQLAAHLIANDTEEGTALIVRPFPGHLTRYPFQAFAHTPLDLYLADGSQLFRQYVRFMLETQWFLSTLSRRSTYRCASGANLLGEGETADESRLTTDHLAARIEEAWLDLHEATRAALDRDYRRRGREPLPFDLEPPHSDAFTFAVAALRDVLHLDEHPKLTGEPSDEREPEIHVLGYSLGASTAESVFMSWPFYITSCATILGGGPLRQLAPTGFAHHEEWQTVLRSLRWELDDLLLDADPDAGSVAGIDSDLFSHIKRVFYEVFQQDFSGGFQTRIATFRQRMLFVVGGSDPVVSPQSVLQSAPPGGMNLLEIGAVGHFLGMRPTAPEEREQQDFWIPELTSLIHRFADHAAGRHARDRANGWFDAEMELPLPEDHPTVNGRRAVGNAAVPEVLPLSPEELLSIEPGGALRARQFERALDDLLWQVTTSPGHGLLLIMRNEIPTMFLPPAAIREKAASLYHDDRAIAEYCRGIRTRLDIVKSHPNPVCLVLPHDVRRASLDRDLHPGYPSQSECSGGQVKQRMGIEESLRRCGELLAELHDRSTGFVRVFDRRRTLQDAGRRVAPALRSEAKGVVKEDLLQVQSMPDCWIWVTRKFLGFRRDAPITRADALKRFGPEVADRLQGDDVADSLADGEVRIVQVSRARYNPRFRGRLLAEPKAAESLLRHAALCVSLADPARSPAHVLATVGGEHAAAGR